MPGTVNSEADIVFNRANVALAKSQRLIASWLPPKTAEELANEKTEAELEKEDMELFTPVPELLGVGAPLPKDFENGLPQRRDLSAVDKLRKQLLGKDALRTKRGPSHSLKTSGSKPLQQAKPQPKEDSEDEDEGRASVISSRKTKKRRDTGMEKNQMQNTEHLEEVAEKGHVGGTSTDNEDNGQAEGRRSLKKRPASFLDEVLAEKAKKKKKSKAKKNAAPVEET